MALKTQGFALSSLGSAPDIPANVGKIDAGAIYASLKQGLDSAEQMRQRTAQQIAADAELKAAAQRAPLRTAVLASQADQAPIQTALLADRAALSGATTPSSILAENATNAATAQGAPYKTAILAAQASPEYIAAQRQHLLASAIPQAYREFEMLTAGMTPEQKEQARRIKFGIDARQSGAAIQYKEVLGPDGVTRTVAFDPRGVGAQVIGTGETYGTGVGGSMPLAQRPAALAAPVVPVAPTEIAAPDATTVPTTTAPNLFASKPEAQAKGEAQAAAEAAKLQSERQQKLPKAQQSLTTLREKTKLVDDTIQEAKALVGPFTVGYGAMLDRLPASDARALKAKIDTIRANIGFDALQEMRNNSPTGGALGAISDYEGQTLQGTLAKLDTGLDAKTFLENLDRVQQARNQTVNRIANAYEQDFNLATGGGSPAAPASAVAPAVSGFKIIEVK